MFSRRFWIPILVLAAALKAACADKSMVFIGCYTGPGKGEGIYSCKFDPSSGAVEGLALAATVQGPSFLALHPNGRYLYAVSEVSRYEGKEAGCVVAFSINPGTGQLQEINRVSSGGAGPCHVAVDLTGRMLAVANYGGGSIASMTVRPDGGLSEPVSVIRRTGSGPNAARQEKSHAHSVVFTPDNRRLLAADLGTDEVALYDVNFHTGSLTAHDPASTHLPPGSGPRHLTFMRGARRFFVANEMLSTVAECTYDAATGAMTVGKALPMLPADFSGTSSAAEIVAHPNGHFIYASNRGHDSVAVYGVAGNAFERVEVAKLGVKTPRSIALDPTGRWLWASGQESGRIAVLPVGRSSGKIGKEVSSVAVGAPVCVVFQAADQ